MPKNESARSTPRKRAVECFTNAADCIGPVKPGLSVFAVTRGQFSMIDVIQHLIREVGPCRVSVWTWAIADYEVEAFTALLNTKAIVGATLVVDRSAENRNVSLIQDWRNRFGQESAKVCKNHSKIARVWTDDIRLLARGSMNLNFNPRFEQFDVTEGGADFDLVERIEAELPVVKACCSNFEADQASQLGKCFEQGTLDLFEGIKPWAK